MLLYYSPFVFSIDVPFIFMEILPIKNKEELVAIHGHDYDVFSDSLDFEWSLEGLKKIQRDGWLIYACRVGDEIVAAVFVKIQGTSLLTKNTPIKLSHQGNSYSDRIKEFYQKMALEHHLQEIYHYCRVDDFRMVALNEDFGYNRTGRQVAGRGHLIEWMKKI